MFADWKNMKDAEKFGIRACPRSDNLFIWVWIILSIKK